MSDSKYTPFPLTAEEVRRLAFVRFCYESGREQARSPYPLSALSLLTLQDAIELALVLACDHAGVQAKPKSGFDEYLTVLVQKTGEEVPHAPPLQKMNKARVSLKHHGLEPTAQSVADYVELARRFFDDAIPLYLGVKLQEVSVTDFVACHSARQKLQEAEQTLGGADASAAVTAAAIAFRMLIDDYVDRKRSPWGASPYAIGSMPPYGPRLRGNSLDDDHRWRDVERYLEKVGRAMDAMEDAITLIGLGIDYRKYRRFRQLTPLVVSGQDGPTADARSARCPSGSEGTAVATFCINFALETAFHLQGFDYTIPNSPPDRGVLEEQPAGDGDDAE